MASTGLSGLGSGIDTNALVTGLVSAASVPVKKLQAEQTNIQSASQTITAFSAKLGALASAASALSTPAGFASFAATSSDPAVVVSTAGAGSAGSYDVIVRSLAREQRTYSAPQGSSTSPLNLSGTLTMQVGSGTPVDVTIAATDSLADVATKISSSGARVGASVLYDGTSYRLLVRGLDTGAGSAVQFTQTGFDLGLSTPANTVQAAKDAIVEIDGIQVKRPTNAINDAIPGLKLALTKETTSPVTVQITSDADALQQKLQTFVKAYNDVVTAGQVAAGYGATRAANPLLNADPAVRMSLHRLGAIIASPVANTTGAYTSLGAVGLSTGRDGKLTLNATKLADSLAKDPASVTRLFVTDSSTGATGVMGTFNTKATELTGPSSVVQGRISSLGTRARRVAGDILDGQRRVDAYEKQLRAQFAQLEKIVTGHQAAGAAVDAIVTNMNNNG